MIYELRTYQAAPGKMSALQARFREHSVSLLGRHGIQIVGFWTYTYGGWSDQLVYLLAFEDIADRERKWASFQADPEWQRVREESQRDGPLTARIRSDILRPEDYSPLQ
jgi:hypothetical protein